MQEKKIKQLNINNKQIQDKKIKQSNMNNKQIQDKKITNQWADEGELFAIFGRQNEIRKIKSKR